MKKSTWRQFHKWFGLILSFFLLMFCLSGLVLNHPLLFDHVNVSRALLPSRYAYQQWDKGLLRGTVRWQNHVLIYGNSGIWMTDSTARCFSDMNQGLPLGIDHRNIRNMVVTPHGSLMAAGQYGLYTYHPQQGWQPIELPIEDGERLTDMSLRGDTLIVTGRSHIYLLHAPYRKAEVLTLRAGANDDGRVSLFRTVWLLHSGALFGLVGRLVVDAIAIVLLLLTLTGIAYWLLPRHKKQQRGSPWRQRLYTWHNHIGRITIVLTLLLSITGWLLRPPALIAIASGRIPAIPLSTMSSTNPWHDNLRSLRYDPVAGDWLLYTSRGFYSLSNLNATPQPLPIQPTVSVMGLNVQEQTRDGYWLIGSFSGLYLWDRTYGRTLDLFTMRPPAKAGIVPFGSHAIAGYSRDFGPSPLIVDYYQGTNHLAMPPKMATMPMSLHALCLEIHTGRFYIPLGIGAILYIFIIGLAIIWCLWSGWKISSSIRGRHRKTIKNALSSTTTREDNKKQNTEKF